MRLPAIVTFLLVVAVAACAGPAPCVAADEAGDADTNPMTVDELLENMEGVRGKVETYTADVVKTRTIEVLDETEAFTGRIQFKAPRLLRMELTDEKKRKTVYIVGEEYGWIYRPYRNQAERGKLSDMKDQDRSGNPLEYGLAKDMRGLKQSYELELLPPETVNGRKAWPLRMTPKGGYETDAVTFWIDAETWLPVQVREKKSNGEIVETHTFSNIRLNEPVPKRAFEFEPGPEVDVIIHDALRR